MMYTHGGLQDITNKIHTLQTQHVVYYTEEM